MPQPEPLTLSACLTELSERVGHGVDFGKFEINNQAMLQKLNIESVKLFEAVTNEQLELKNEADLTYCELVVTQLNEEYRLCVNNNATENNYSNIRL